MKKIMFNDKAGLTESVFKGNKTQTRRTISLKDGEYVVVTKLDDGEYMSYVAKEGSSTAYIGALKLPNFVRPLAPKYFIGEVVAVAQSYNNAYDNAYDRIATYTLSKAGFHNKMFVKAELMPHHIRITNIRVEQLQDISDEDCLKEGIHKVNYDTFVVDGINVYDDGIEDGHYLFDTPREAYAVLIDKVSGKGTWESNPYVFVYDFELVD